jgi:uncharacterized protein (TIGR03086 family)
VFVLSDMTIEAHDFPTGRVLGFNGTTEWALDSVEATQALWLPGEGQLRDLLGEDFLRLERAGGEWAVTACGAGGLEETTRHADAEEAYALALLALRADSARDLLAVAAARVTARVRAVRDGAWSSPTPDDRWTVRDLLNHLAAEHRWVPHLLAGQSLASVGDRYDGDVLGDDPVRAWEQAIAASLSAWAATGLDASVELSTGPTPAGEYAEQMLLDLVVHGWDLARATRQDEQLDAASVRHVMAYAAPRAASWSTAGIFGPPVQLPEGATEQDRLLALTGRDPR